MNQIRKRLTYANVMSSLAVFLVLGGGAAFAAVNLPGNSVGTKQLKKNAVKTGKVSFEAIRAGKLSKNAVPTNRLRNNAVANNKIADLAVTTGKLFDESVTSGKIGKDAVLTDKIADNAVTTGKIADNAVTTDKLGDEAVTTGKLGGDAVTRDKIADSKFLPRAFAFINDNGTVQPAFTDGVPNAVNLAAGIYCFDLPFLPVHAQVSPEVDGGSDEIASVDVAGAVEAGLTNCPAGNEVEVNTFTDSVGLANEDFWLILW